MPTGIRRLAPVGISVLLAVTLSGCSGDPAKPSTVPTPSVSSGVSTSPAALTKKAQVEAAVRAYYRAFTRAARTSNAEVLASHVARSCPCFNAIKIIRTNVRQGESTPDAAFLLKSVRVHDIAKRTAAAEVRFVAKGYDVLDPSMNVKKHIPSSRHHLDLSLVQTGHGWIIANLFDLESS